jgi:DNA-binding PadR family transcriptional regulator
VVLGLLCDGQPRHGYAVAKEYRRRSGLTMNTGSVYRELQRLAAEGLVRAVHNPPEADGRRSPYTITALGKATFESWLSSTRDAWTPSYEDALSSRALFLGAVDAQALSGVLERWSEALWSLVKAIERDREASFRPSESPATPFSPLSLLQARRLKHLAVELEFLDEFRSAHALASLQSGGATIPQATASPAPDVEESSLRRRRPSSVASRAESGAAREPRAGGGSAARGNR